MRHYYLVSYDISDQKRWRKIFKIMKGYGEHVQYSVFLCQLSNTQKAELIAKLDPVIHQFQDQIMLVHIGPVTSEQLEKRISTIGRKYIAMDLKNLVY
ncbi:MULTISPECIES: CRISPR-associated endonuclease Cas2 [Laceyella]|jgi:CRISPR-associated protein Cas2|uniref:CRISPR-associated endoribonuclease Cas2 n=2 Tax=Laceyella TaxID=292635 RepID=A0ABY5U1Z2_LACSH|nr:MULTISPECIES: CRISPR-associated endonuclease Cas2 [Laceyella]MRG29656.1 CRISPR-associated endonuclease Cas2 [Laceyella tengchongensis]PRZ16636.1 CRISPR-associated Cas2 family protein [Laceyella sediminis]UWE03681.1 CRISPR-associated endonuclease Cas2 [Laceyella sacchari]